MTKEKKVETKTQRILNYVVMAVEITIIIACIIFSITIISGQRIDPEQGLNNGINITTVYSDSMDSDKEVFNQYRIGSFKIGDVLLIKNIAGDTEEYANLQEGDVISYFGIGPTGETALISHRVYKIKIIDVDGQQKKQIFTLGDRQYSGNETADDMYATAIPTGNIQGIVVGKLSKIGYAIIWLKDSTHFLLSIVFPLALLLVYNAYLLVRMILDYKIKKLKEQNEMAVAAIKAESPVDEEEIKRKAIEEYLAQQKAQEEPKDEKLEDANIVQDEKTKG